MIAVICGAILAVEAHAQEITTFKLTSLRGLLSTGYNFEDRRDESAGRSQFGQSQELWSNLFISTQSYVYHPAFLRISFAGGPRFLQRSNQQGAAESSADGTLFSYNLKLEFLNSKPYQHTLYASSSDPVSGTGLAGRFRTTTTEYGIRGRLPVPLLPNAIYWEASHGKSEGTALGRIEDSSSDRASMRTVLPVMGGLNFDLEWSERDSSRGSPGVPINATQNENFSASLSGNTEFGAKRRYRLSQYMLHLRSETTSRGIPETKSFRYTGSLAWSTSSRLGWSSSYSYSNVSRGIEDRLTQNLSGAMKYRISRRFAFNGNARLSESESTGFTRNSTGLTARLRYNRQTPIGRLTATGSGSRARIKQQAFQKSGEVFDELIELTGIESVTLQEEFILDNTILVTNTDRTQTYVEGLDYRTIVIGGTTSIERIADGNILDGEQVFVSYDYEIGGTVEYGSWSQGVSVSLALPKYIGVSVGISRGESEVLSGEPTNPLNDRTVFDARVDARYPSKKGITIGGEVRYTRNEQTISPFESMRYDTFLQWREIRNTRVRLEYTAQTVDYEDSREGVDRQGYSVVVNTRIPAGIAMAYRGNFYEDGGGSVAKKSERHYLMFGWRYRLVDLTVNVAKSIYRQDLTSRADTEVNIQFRRFF